MQIRVLFFGQLKDITGASEERVQVEQGASLESVFESYAHRFPKLAAMRSSIVVARNQEFAAPATLLSDGDEVAFLPPVSGGSGPRVDVNGREADIIEIVHAPIDTRALAARLLRGEDGAVVAFEGVVRNHSGGRPTLFLEYEAYEAMALEQMRALARGAREKWPIDSVAIVHRLGRLEISETSVAIIVTSAHRGPAYEASRYLIDHLKKTVPIWKKEHFADGAVWVEGQWDESLKK